MSRQTYSQWRHEFIGRLQSEGVSKARALVILTNANKLQRLAVDECSDEAAYLMIERAKQRCPQCAHDEPDARTYQLSPASRLGSSRGWCLEHKATAAIREAVKGTTIRSVDFSGDPRGSVVKLRMASGIGDSWGDSRDLCVPAKEF